MGGGCGCGGRSIDRASVVTQVRPMVLRVCGMRPTERGRVLLTYHASLHVLPHRYKSTPPQRAAVLLAASGLAVGAEGVSDGGGSRLHLLLNARAVAPSSRNSSPAVVAWGGGAIEREHVDLVAGIDHARTSPVPHLLCSFASVARPLQVCG